MNSYVLSHKLAMPDAFIASTSLKYNLELYTYNIKDFKYLKDIKLYQPI